MSVQTFKNTACVLHLSNNVPLFYLQMKVFFKIILMICWRVTGTMAPLPLTQWALLAYTQDHITLIACTVPERCCWRRRRRESRWCSPERVPGRQPNLYSPIPEQLGALCQWLGCRSCRPAKPTYTWSTPSCSVCLRFLNPPHLTPASCLLPQRVPLPQLILGSDWGWNRTPTHRVSSKTTLPDQISPFTSVPSICC